jgi:WD40 repeat protein/energy-coupling factor transporter ATP-binding protein EcfA2
MNTSEFKLNLAVVIGINDYQNGVPPLGTARKDAEAIADILKTDYQYQVHLFTDKTDTQATSQNLSTWLGTELPELLKAANPSRLLFYFAGHGIALNGDDGPQGYLILQDAKLGDSETYLPMQLVEKALSKLSCRHCLVILDCCFAGAFRWSSTRKLTSIAETIHKERYDRFIQDPAWQVITSAASDQYANDNLDIKGDRGIAKSNSEHSPFAAALIEALSGEADAYPLAKNGKKAGDGVITASELHMYLSTSVGTLTDAMNRLQTPQIWCLKKHDKGEFIFLPPGHKLNLPDAPSLDELEDNNPYQGLKSYETKDSALFFGRTALIHKLCDAMSDRPFTVVLGTSGSGKSSLVKAGLIPHLDGSAQTAQSQNQRLKPQEYLHQCKHKGWKILAPIRPGESPLNSLNSALKELGVVETDQNDSKMLSKAIASWSQSHSEIKLLLVIDQFEELITQCRNDQERQQFLDLLAFLLKAHPDAFRLVVTLRSDFEPQFRSTPLEPLWQDARFVVPAMTREELRAVIEEPASARVVYFESLDNRGNLVDQLIDEVAGMPGALPLLSFALSELYLKLARRYLEKQITGDPIERAITWVDYDELGGVTKSLTRRADEEYDAFVKVNPAYEQTIRHVMLRMVAVGGEMARRQVPEAELKYPEPENTRVQEVIKQFSSARLLVSGIDANENSYIEPAHDALIRGWENLRIWKKEEEENVILQRRLTPAADEWNNIKSRDKNSQKSFLNKAVPIMSWLDRQLFIIEIILNKIPAQFAQILRRSQNQQVQSKENAIQFLWDSNPYLAFLDNELHSENNWLNQIESEFVQESVLKKRQNISWKWRIAIGVIAGLSGLTAYAFIQTSIAKRNEQVSFAQKLAAQSQILEFEDPNLFELSTLLAVESVRRNIELGISSLSGNTALINSIQKLPLPIWSEELEQPLNEDQVFQKGKIITFADNKNEFAYIDGNHLVSINRNHFKKINLFNFPIDSKERTVSSNLKHVAWIEGTNVVRIAQISSPKKITTINLSKEYENSGILFGPDNKYISIANKLYQLNKDGIFTQIDIPDIDNVVFSPDGQYVAGYRDKDKTIWKINTREKVLDVPYQAGSHFGQDFVLSSNARYFATAGSHGKAEVWDTVSKKILLHLSEGQTGWTTAIAISRNGRYLALGQRSAKASIWDITSGEKVMDIQIEGSYDWTSSIMFSPDDNYIAATSRSITKIYSLISKHEVARISDKRGDYTIMQNLFSSDSKNIITFFAGQSRDDKKTINKPKLKIWNIDNHYSFNSRLFDSPNCESLFLSNTSGETTIVSILKNKLFLPKNEKIFNGYLFTCSKSGNTLVLINENDLHLFKLFNEEWNLFKTFNLKFNDSLNKSRYVESNFYGFSPNEDELIIGFCIEKQSIIPNCKPISININTGRKTEYPISFYSERGIIAISGRYLATVNTRNTSQSNNNTLKIFNLLNSKVSNEFAIGQLSVKNIVFSDERYVGLWGGSFGASGNNSSDGFLLVYDILLRKKIFDRRFERAVLRAVFHPSNKYISAEFLGGDNSFRVWNINNGDEILRLPNVSASFDKTGKYIRAISRSAQERLEKSELTLLPFDMEDMSERACSRLGRNLTIQEWNQYLGNQPFRKTCPNLEIDLTQKDTMR